MMRFFILVLTLITAFAASVSLAGTYGLGNGGHVLRCAGEAAWGSHFFDGVTLLDLHEGAIYHGYTYRRLSSLNGLSLDKAFAKALATYLKDDPRRATFAKWFERRHRETTMAPSLEIWPGSFSWSVDRLRCSIEQAAVQFLTMYPRPGHEGRLTISTDLWNGTNGKRPLAVPLKVALLLHEYVYRHLAVHAFGCALSDVRAETAFILSDQALAETSMRREFRRRGLHCLNRD